MPLRLFLLLAVICPFLAFSQLLEDFSDGDLTNNPTWTGDIADFIVTPDKMLQLNAATAGTSDIHTQIALGDSAEWSFYYRMAFAPSASNRIRIYLMLDSDTLTNASGYFIEIGENGSSDALHMYRLDSGIETEIAMSAGLFGGDPSSARVRVVRDGQGSWSCEADVNGGENYLPLFNIAETTYPLSGANIFCVECTYTDTRRDKFFFDDFFAGLPAPDTTSAALEEVTALDETHVEVRFSEELDSSSAVDPAHYSIVPAIGSPAIVSFVGTEHHDVLLSLSSALHSGTNYTLQVDGVRDLSGNSTTSSLEFTFLQLAKPNPYDILINEIMADPSPPVGLPNAEYVELYNISDAVFDLADFVFTAGTQSVLLPSYAIETGSYVVLVDTDNSNLFTGVEHVLPVNLPTLTNSGTILELADDMGVVIHRISYDLSSYQDPARDEGGWSLELINPFAPCMVTGNLHASQDLTGGTPGRPNSVLASEPDTAGPVLERVIPLSDTHLSCVFDEVISEMDIQVTLQPVVNVVNVAVEDNVLDITLATPVEPGLLYTVTIVQISDCIGNQVQSQTFSFALPQPAETGDVFINEILFDPGTGGSRFVEVINVSDKHLDMHELVIADIEGDTLSVSPVETEFLFSPGAIVAVTPDPQDLISRYPTHDAMHIVGNTLPSFSRTQGNITVYTRSGVILDAFDYNADMHNPLLDDPKGVSLERLSTTLNTQSRENWHSAAETAGFATPGMPNSQRLPDVSGSGVIEVTPDVFSPDDDGTDDFLLISFPGVQADMIATVRVYDAQGRVIAEPARNVSIGVDAVIRWDGIDVNGDRARIGPYVLWIELYAADGTVKRYKRTCVLAERL